MTEREELRRLIDVIERGSSTVSVEQAIDDIRTFANTASFLANNLDARLNQRKAKSKPIKAPQPITQRLPAPAQPEPKKPVEPQPAGVGRNAPVRRPQLGRGTIKPVAPLSPTS